MSFIDTDMVNDNLEGFGLVTVSFLNYSSFRIKREIPRRES